MARRAGDIVGRVANSNPARSGEIRAGRARSPIGRSTGIRARPRCPPSWARTMAPGWALGTQAADVSTSWWEGWPQTGAPEIGALVQGGGHRRDGGTGQPTGGGRARSRASSRSKVCLHSSTCDCVGGVGRSSQEVVPACGWRWCARGEDSRHEFGVSGRTATDHEKGCSHLVLGEDLRTQGVYAGSGPSSKVSATRGAEVGTEDTARIDGLELDDLVVGIERTGRTKGDVAASRQAAPPAARNLVAPPAMLEGPGSFTNAPALVEAAQGSGAHQLALPGPSLSPGPAACGREWRRGDGHHHAESICFAMSTASGGETRERRTS